MEIRIEVECIEAMSKYLKKKILWIEMSPLGKPGDNYVSSLFSTTIAYQDDDEVQHLSIVYKAPLVNDDDAVNKSLDSYREVEKMVYNEVLTVFNDLLNEIDETEKLWPDCYYISSSNVILMENLKVSGFELPRDVTMMTDDLSMLSLKALGKFHGLSVVAVNRGLIKPDSRYKLFFTDELGDGFVLNGMMGLINAIKTCWGQEWHPVADKLLLIKETVMNDIRNFEREEPRIKVINHGDIWSRNLMFKYNNDNQATSIRFIDYQCLSYCSYGFDLCMLMTSCIPFKLTNNYNSLTELVQIYVEAFSEILIAFNCDPNSAPSVYEVLNELKRLELFRLVICCTVLPLQCYQGDKQMDLFKDDEALDLDRETKEARDQLYSNPVLKDILQDIFKNSYKDILN